MSLSMDVEGTTQRLLPRRAVPEDLDAHLGGLGPRPILESSAMIDALDQSGLRGRGGADFPTGVKWRAVIEHTQRGGEAVVVANAAVAPMVPAIGPAMPISACFKALVGCERWKMAAPMNGMKIGA